MNRPRATGKLATISLVIPMVLAVALAAGAQQPEETGSATGSNHASTFTLKIESDLVLTNVVVRDKKTGQLVRGLTAKDFSIEENGKPQHIASFDFESVDEAAPLNEGTVSGRTTEPILGTMNRAATSAELRNHRLIVMFFDITSMQPDDLERSQQAARNYINKQMQPADLVAVVSLDSSLSLDQDFTANKQLLQHAVDSYSGTQEAGFAAGASSTTNQVEDASSFTADEQEYNDINTDRELFALEDIAHSLSYINEKKSVLYFSGGIQRDGIENQASLHAAINAAVRANLSIYSVDTRGLQAISPLGDATTGSLRGTSAYSGAALQNNLDSNFNSQEVMATLSSDTGGKAFFDSNDFSAAFQRIQNDTSAYYALGFRSADPRRDGRYRRLTIKVDRPDVKLEYRPGYYAPADFQHSNREDRERQLEEALDSDLPATDVEVFMQAYYFRADAQEGPGRFFVPISLIVPGSQIPFVQGGDRSKATLDILGSIKNTAGQEMGNIRQTVKLNVGADQQVSRKNVQYTTTFTLPSGRYHVKFVIRENETGRMGSFESDLDLPDFRKMPLKMSSVLISNQRVADKKRDPEDPLVEDGYSWVPNVAHVFRADQHLYFLYEVYDPATGQAKTAGGKRRQTAGDSAVTAGTGIRVLTSIEFLQGSKKVFQTPLVQASAINAPERNATAFAFDLPLSSIPPGAYICQVNVIDDTAGSFTFPRLAVVVRGEATVPPATPPITPPPTAQP